MSKDISLAKIYSRSIAKGKMNNLYLAPDAEDLFITWFPVDLNLH